MVALCGQPRDGTV